MKLPNQERIGRYQLLELIGSGGIASVYHAFDPMFARDVAMKVMHGHYSLQEGLRKRFIREAQATARLNHPGIVEVFDCSRAEDQRLYIVMELVRGPSLDQLLAQWREEKRQIPLPEVVKLMRQLAEATAFANKYGVLHRDIKPANILMKPRWPLYTGEMLCYDPVIADFGLARLEGSSTITQTGVSIGGTPAYMAPEQIGDDPLDERCDLYSLGVIFYELVTNQLPFQLRSLTDVLRQHVANPLPLTPPQLLRPDLPNRLNELIVHTLERERSRRLPSSQALAQALAAISGDTAPKVQKAYTPSPHTPSPRIPPPRIDAAHAEGVVTNTITTDESANPILFLLPVSPRTRLMALAVIGTLALVTLVLYFLARLPDGGSIPTAPVAISTETIRFVTPEVITNTAETAWGRVVPNEPPPDLLTPETGEQATTANKQLFAAVIGPETIHPTEIWIDGDPTDWQVLRALAKVQVTPMEAVYNNETNRGCQARYPGTPAAVDLSAAVQFAYDSTYLYVSFLVQDDGYVANPDPLNYWQGDAIQLLLSLDGADWAGSSIANHPDADEFQIDLLPGASKIGDGPAVVFSELARPTDIQVYSEAHAAVSATADGYFLEAALPWSTLSTLPPRAGRILSVAPNVSDNDTPTALLQECMLSVVPNFVRNSPASWAVLTLE